MRRFVLVLACFLCLIAARAFAAPSVPSLVSPKSAILSPKGADLVLERTLPVVVEHGEQYLSFVLPQGSEDIRVQAEDCHVIKEEHQGISLPAVSSNAQRIRALEDRLGEIGVALKVLETRRNLWKLVPESIAVSDIETLDAQKKARGVALLQEEFSLLKEEQEVREELKELKSGRKLADRGLLVRLCVKGAKTPTVLVRCSYHVSSCGWRPSYVFSIDPDRAKDEIRVLLKADIWQNTGHDWENTEISLVTGSRGKHAPNQLASWLIEEERPKVLNAKNTRSSLIDSGSDTYMAAGAVVGSVGRSAAPNTQDYSEEPVVPRTETGGIYAKWVLPVRSLSHGHAMVTISESVWKEKLLWIARPDTSRADVFLMATHDIADGEVWPKGKAAYSVSGQVTGEDVFSSTGGTVTLFFGQDPRVSFEVVQDKRKQGESGFLGRDKRWFWSWSYLVHNMHNHGIRLRIERPEPRAVQEKIIIQQQSTPKAELDPKKHALVWELDVPAGGREKVQHSVTVTAPESMNVHPLAP